MNDGLSRRDLLRALALGAVAGPMASWQLARGASTARAATPTRPNSAAANLTLREKIGRLLVVGFGGTSVTPASPVSRAIAAGELGGVILFGRNIVSPSQVAALTGELAGLAPSAAPLLVATDQEGGRVQRLAPRNGHPAVPSQEVMARRGRDDAARVYGAMAESLAAAGINLNLAPVVDLDINPRNPAVGALQRAFSADPEVVTVMARTAVRAHRRHGLATALKHFPGLGSAAANTDFTATVDVTRTWSRIELAPYRDLIASGDAECVMVGHTLNRVLDPWRPASLSRPTVDGLLRGEMGWHGPVITDDLRAAAIAGRFTWDGAAVAALQAGADLLLYSAAPAGVGYSGLVSAIVNAVRSGVLDEARIDAAVARVAALRGRIGGGDVKFIQLSGADLEGLDSIAVPEGTPIEDFTGVQWATIGPTNLRVLPGLANADVNRRIVVVSTSRFYEDGRARPTAQVALLRQ